MKPLEPMQRSILDAAENGETHMALPKLDTGQRVGDLAFEAIQEAIMNGDFPAGRRLQIRELAAELGISVMPVREAIKRLEEQGLVENVPYRGAEVKQFTREELLYIYDVRKLVEMEASRLGVVRLAKSDLPELEQIYQDMLAAMSMGNIVEYLDLDEKLLITIYRAAGNPVLTEIIEQLWRRCRTYKIFGARNEYASGHVSELSVHQFRLIQAAKDQDAEQAGKITEESLDAAMLRIRRGMPKSEDASSAAT